MTNQKITVLFKLVRTQDFKSKSYYVCSVLKRVVLIQTYLFRLFVCLPVNLTSLLLHLYDHLSTCLFVCPLLCLLIRLSAQNLFVCPSVCLSIWLSICLSLWRASVCLSVLLSAFVCPFIYPSVRLFVYLHIYLSVRLSLCLFIRLSFHPLVYLFAKLSVSAEASASGGARFWICAQFLPWVSPITFPQTEIQIELLMFYKNRLWSNSA